MNQIQIEIIRLFHKQNKMGNDCLASSPLQHYNSYFENIKTSELKDYWTTIQVYKIKKLYDSIATKHPEYNKHTRLEPEQFFTLFAELEKYPERQKMRVFELFNFDGSGNVDWNNFYSMISICYFGSEETLAIIMFLIFDQSLAKQLTKAEVELMCEHNQSYIVTKQQMEEQISLYSPFDVADHLLQGKTTLQLQSWIQHYKTYFSISKFRRLFNIFVEEKLQKELIQNFNEYNNLYVESEDRYVSYIIDFKWFESWKLYVKQEYGYCLTSSNKKPTTFKSKKTLKSSSKNVVGPKKVADPLTLRQLKFDEGKQSKSTKKHEEQDEAPEEVKNFDFIHSNIGQKPKQIYNKVLEGDFEQVLRQDIIQNRDYVFLSERVWKTLKKIYEGYPQFRRTGFDFIELYPKILRIIPFRNGSMRYSEQNIKEVSAYYGAEDVLEAILTKLYMENKEFYFKTIGGKKWEKIEDLSIALAELTPQIIIYIVAVHENEVQAFTKKHIKIPKDISEINVGDQVKFEHPEKKRQQTMIFLGKNVEGKSILHQPGESYIYDICLMESELIKKAKLSPIQQTVLDQLKVKKKDDQGLIGIPNAKGLGYINSVIMHLFYNWNFKQQLQIANIPEQPLSVLSTLSKVYKDLTNKKKINTKIISETIQEILPDFNQFSADMCNEFFNQFLKAISTELTQQEFKDHTASYLVTSERTIQCKKCKNVSSEKLERYTLSLPLHTNAEKFYEIIFVPYSQSLNGGQMMKYGFKLKLGAKLSDYKDAFETVAGLKDQNRKYLLMQIYANNIVKNYSTAKNDATLDELLLRESDVIIAYELKVDFSDFIAKHYAQNVDFDNNEVRIDQFIDCKNSTRGWIFGKVCQKDFTPYGHRTIIRVIHKFSKGEQWEISYDVDDESVANFPTKSYLNGEQFHLRLQQRYFNEASNDMEICNMPLVVVLTNWMRWREFYYMIYLQMRRFINESCFENQFFQENQQENDYQIYSSKSLKNKKKTQKIKLNKFKEFLYGPGFPYRLTFIDYSGRCAICFKFLKSKVFHGENQTYCNGCQLSASQPISWQIKVADVMVCVDWKKLDYFKKDIVRLHSSHVNLTAEKKNDIQTLASCLENLKNGYVEIVDQICCHNQAGSTIKQKVLTLPANLTIYLERIIEENGFIKIINKYVKFPDTLQLENQTYSLVGLTTIEGGSNKSNKYRAFVMISGEEWLQYDGNVVRCVKRNYIQKLCALNLLYKKKEA